MQLHSLHLTITKIVGFLYGIRLLVNLFALDKTKRDRKQFKVLTSPLF